MIHPPHPLGTKADAKRHREAVRALGCLFCGRPAAIHHVPPTRRRPGDDVRYTRDDWYVLPLCDPGCHKDSGHGLHDGEATWVERHGTQAEWLTWVDKRLEARA